MKQDFRVLQELGSLNTAKPPLTSFGADAVEKWFTEKEVSEVVEFANRLAV